MSELRTDIENLQDGDRVRLHPNASNPLHEAPFDATFSGGYFFADGSPHEEGPDYYWRDVLRFNDGFELIASLSEAGDAG